MVKGNTRFRIFIYSVTINSLFLTEPEYRRMLELVVSTWHPATSNKKPETII